MQGGGCCVVCCPPWLRPAFVRVLPEGGGLLFRHACVRARVLKQSHDVCWDARASLHACVCLHACAHACMHASAPLRVRACACRIACACMHACACACVRALACPCVRALACPRVRACVFACVPLRAAALLPHNGHTCFSTACRCSWFCRIFSSTLSPSCIRLALLSRACCLFFLPAAACRARAVALARDEDLFILPRVLTTLGCSYLPMQIAYLPLHLSAQCSCAPPPSPAHVPSA